MRWSGAVISRAAVSDAISNRSVRSLWLPLDRAPLPMIQRSGKPNWVYGLRVPATLADDWVWYEADARSGRDPFVLGVVQLLAALFLPLVAGITVDGYAPEQRDPRGGQCGLLRGPGVAARQPSAGEATARGCAGLGAFPF